MNGESVTFLKKLLCLIEDVELKMDLIVGDVPITNSQIHANGVELKSIKNNIGNTQDSDSSC